MSVMNALKSAHGRLVFQRRVNVLASSIAPLLPAGRILDVGCGDGTIAELLLGDRPDIEITGIDTYLRPISHIPVSKFDGVNIPFEDNSFDCAIVVDVLHHIDDCLPLLRECARVCRRVIIKDHLANNVLDYQILKAMDWAGNRPHGIVLAYNYLSTNGWNELYSKAGLKREESLTSLPIHSFPLSLLFGRKLHFIDVLSTDRSE